ncbi:MAG: entericidin A/B family lipoprotein [Limisphaerales bacterium]
MTTSIKRLAVFLCFTALLAVVSVGCNTAQGFGEDVEKVGDKIQEGTD